MYTVQLVLLRLSGRLIGFLIRAWIILNNGKCGSGFIVESGFRLKYPPHSGIRIGNNVCIGKQTTFDIPKGSKLEIGSDVSLTGYSYISAAKEVVIGNHVIIGEFVSIRDANHSAILGAGFIKEQTMSAASIVLGDDIWIGRGVAILKGVKIANGSIVGANAVVIKDIVIANSLNTGIPCHFIKLR